MERIVSSTNIMGKIVHMQKNTILILYYTQKSTKKKKRPKYKTATVKFLNENIGEKLHDIGLRTDFLDVM